MKGYRIVEGGVYVTGVETVELDNVTVDAFRAALAVDRSVNSVLKGLSCIGVVACELE